MGWYWYCRAVKKYCVFEGRARRAEYWQFHLVQGLITFGFFLLAAAYDFIITAIMEQGGIDLETISGGWLLVLLAPVMLLVLLGLLHRLAMILPSWAATVRRLHDIGRSGWWSLIDLLPGGILILLIFLCQDGQFGRNQYGPNPKRSAVI